MRPSAVDRLVWWLIAQTVSFAPFVVVIALATLVLAGIEMLLGYEEASDLHALGLVLVGLSCLVISLLLVILRAVNLIDSKVSQLYVAMEWELRDIEGNMVGQINSGVVEVNTEIRRLACHPFRPRVP